MNLQKRLTKVMSKVKGGDRKLSTSTSAKDFKILLEALEGELEAEEAFFSLNADSILSTLYEEYVSHFGNFQKGKRGTKFSKIVDILKKVIIHNSEKVKELWGFDNIVFIVASMIHPYCSHNVRKIGFRTLQIFIECFTIVPKDIVELLGKVVLLTTFQDSGSSGTSPQMKLPENLMLQSEAGLCVFPSPHIPQKGEALDLLDLVLCFIGQLGPERFQLWFSLLKRTYLSVCYPEPCRKLGFVSEVDGGGFIRCPHEIQEVWLKHIVNWGTNNNAHIVQALWQHPPLLMEISRQACVLPIEFASAIDSSIKLFKKWLLDLPLGGSTQLYWQQFIQNTALFITRAAPNSKNDQFSEISLKILQIYVTFAVECYQKMDASTWEVLQTALLGIVYELETRVQVTDGISNSIFNVLFLVWVRAPHASHIDWTPLKKKVELLINRKSAVDMWVKNMLQLTYIMRNLFYPSMVKEAVKIDPYYSSLPWTKESIVLVWTTMFNIFGSFNKMESVTHEISMKFLHDACLIFLQAEAKFPKAEPPLSVFRTFYPILKETVNHVGVPISGLVVAYRTLCKMFCWNLTGTNKLVVNSDSISGVLGNSGDIIAQNAVSDSKNNSSEGVNSRQSILTAILASFFRVLRKGLNDPAQVIVFEVLQGCQRLFSAPIPNVTDLIQDFLDAIWKVMIVGEKSFFSLPISAQLAAITILNSLICVNAKKEINLQDRVPQFLCHFLKFLSESDNDDVINCVIFGACVFVYNESNQKPPRTDLIELFVLTTSQFTEKSNENLVLPALDALITISQALPSITTSDPLSSVVIDKLTSNLLRLLEGPLNTVKRETFIVRTYNCILAWLHSCEYAHKLLHNDKVLTSKLVQATELGIQSVIKSPASWCIKEAAEFFGEQLLLTYNSVDPASTGSNNSEKLNGGGNDDSTFHFAFRDCELWSVTENAREQRNTRLAIRKPSGVLAWDIQKKFITDTEKPEELPLKKLQLLLQYIFDEHTTTECTLPLGIHFSILEGKMSVGSSVLRRSFQVFGQKVPKYDIRKSTAIIAPPDFSYVIQLNNDINRGTPENKTYDFARLSNTSNDKFSRVLRELDRLLPTTGVKAAIIYVGPNQVLQGDILKNEGGSPAYERFLKAVGSKIDLSTHKGYKGGLDTEKFSSGKFAIYSERNSEETIFHVSTLMPTVPSDLQQVNKKKHIGNDFVHIVWCESGLEYEWNTITSHFNDVHIIIYPLENKLFRICVHKKSTQERNIPTFGPLMEGMMVTEEILPYLVKQTALFANRNCRGMTKGYVTPHHARLEMIRELIAHAVKAEKEIQGNFSKNRSEELPKPDTPLLTSRSDFKLKRSVSMESLVDMRKTGRTKYTPRRSPRSPEKSSSVTPEDLIIPNFYTFQRPKSDDLYSDPPTPRTPSSGSTSPHGTEPLPSPPHKRASSTGDSIPASLAGLFAPQRSPREGTRDARDARERDAREAKEAREARETRDTRETRDNSLSNRSASVVGNNPIVYVPENSSPREKNSLKRFGFMSLRVKSNDQKKEMENRRKAEESGGGGGSPTEIPRTSKLGGKGTHNNASREYEDGEDMLTNNVGRARWLPQLNQLLDKTGISGSSPLHSPSKNNF